MSLTTAHSLLFVPGNRPERFAKAAASGADVVVLDLEDAVQPGDKDAARAAAAAWFAAGHAGMLRINAADTPWHAADLALLHAAPNAAVLLPKADADAVAATLSALPGRALVALVENVRGYMQLRRLAALPGVVRIAFGSVDFSADSGITDVDDAMTAVRTSLVLESCFAGIAPPIDGVSVAIDDADAITRDAQRSRQLGFGGKLCIHPRQVALVNAAFRPSASDVDWARRVLAADARSDGNATTVDGAMVDKPVVEQARRLLAAAREATD